MRENLFNEKHNISFRFSQEQYDWIGREAAKQRISRAELVRRIIDAEMTKTTPKATT